MVKHFDAEVLVYGAKAYFEILQAACGEIGLQCVACSDIPRLFAELALRSTCGVLVEQSYLDQPLYELVQQVRRYSPQAFFLLLVDSPCVRNRAMALRAEVDDCLLLPPDIELLQARIGSFRARLTTLSPFLLHDAVVHASDISLNTATHSAFVGTHRLRLQSIQIHILALLLHSEARYIRPEAIQHVLWGWKCELTHSSFDEHIASLNNELRDAGYLGAITGDIHRGLTLRLPEVEEPQQHTSHVRQEKRHSPPSNSNIRLLPQKSAKCNS